MRILAVLGAVVIAGAVALWLAVRAPAEPASGSSHAPPAPTTPAPPSSSPAPTPAPRASAGSPVEAGTALVDERTQLFETLRASGSAEEEWTTRGSALLAQLSRGASAVLESGCFVAGCGASYSFASEEDYRRHRAALEGTAEYRAWTGGKRWTEPERDPDGHVRIGLFLYRPD